MNTTMIRRWPYHDHGDTPQKIKLCYRSAGRRLNDKFSLSIANAVPGTSDPSRPDYHAPDRLLGLAPAHTLGDKKQSDARSLIGQLEIVRDLLLQQSDLHIRLRGPEARKLPARTGLLHLHATLPLTSDAVRASGASTVRVSGGMHLSVALALGTALPETKVGHVELIDLRDEVWRSKAADDPQDHDIVTENIDLDLSPDVDAESRIAVFVTLTQNADQTAFRRLVRERPGIFSSAAVISLAPKGLIDAREGARLSTKIANELKRISAEYGRAEIHLAFHGPTTMAVLVGRYLNTLRTVVYEWDNPEDVGPIYSAVLTLEPGVAGGPITRVH